MQSAKLMSDRMGKKRFRNIRVYQFAIIFICLLAVSALLLGRKNIRIALHNKKGADFYRKGMYDEAMAEFKKAIMIKADYPEAYNNLGVIYRQKAMYNDAITCFNEAIRLNPNFAVAYYNVARTYSQKGEKTLAIKSLKSAVVLDSRYADAAQTEEAFDNIRDSEEFLRIVQADKQ